MKYLGRIITANNSDSHIERAISSANKTCSFLKLISGCTFGISPRKGLLLHKAFVRSKLEYACPLFSKLSKTVIDKIKTLTNLNLRKVLGLIVESETELVLQQPPLPN